MGSLELGRGRGEKREQLVDREVNRLHGGWGDSMLFSPFHFMFLEPNHDTTFPGDPNSSSVIRL